MTDAQIQEEIASIRTHAAALSTIPIVLPDDFISDREEWPRKFTVFPVDLPPPPQTRGTAGTGSGSGSNAGAGAGSTTINITIKSSKPVISFPLSVHPTDTIASVKALLASEHARAPLAEIQRLVIKGKVLADERLVKEYEGLVDGSVINLMIKPGSSWTGEEKTTTASTKPTTTTTTTTNAHSNSNTLKPDAEGKSGQGRRSHSRTPSEGGAADQYPVPSLVLQTPTSPTNTHPRPPQPLSLDTNTLPPRPSSPLSATDTGTYFETISSTKFWINLREFLGQEFRKGEDGDNAFESFLVASKGSLSPGDIARIRDAVGVTGMSGT